MHKDTAVPQARDGWELYTKNAWKRGQWRVWDEEWATVDGGTRSVWVAWKMPLGDGSPTDFEATQEFETVEHAMIYAETMEAVGA